MSIQQQKRLTSVVLILSLFIVFPLFTHAETRISSLPSTPTIIWNKEGSPYILDKAVTLGANQKFLIGPGVVIKSSSPPTSSDFNTIWADAGEVIISGTKNEPVLITGLWTMGLGKKGRIEHAILDGTGIYSTSATMTILSTRISNASLALDARASYIDIRDSEFINNRNGILSAPLRFPAPMVMRVDDPAENHITIHNSSIISTKFVPIRNLTLNTIDATDNWWGSPTGPVSTSTIGPVIVNPWLTEAPKEKIRIVCCSSVLFLPGLEASRLHGGTNQLWEPNRNDDVRKLSLTSEGASIDPSIYAHGIIDYGLGLPWKNIYGKFIAMMNGVVADKTITSWLPFAYDWRMSPAYATTTKKLIEEVERLASTSKTGKVTVIAHSNGGLVAKALGSELEKIGKAGLIDKVLFVAVPELGTPQAIAGMLHGTDQALGKGLILESGVARTFGLTMPGAYGLLPSSEYFNRIVEPVITFAGKAVGSYESLANFLTGKSDGRSQPQESDLKSPSVLSASLLSKATSMHSLLDSWRFPTTTDVMSLVGWGTPTTRTIEYSTSSPRIIKGPEGDGTVVINSTNPSLYFNQGLFNHDNRSDVEHANILDADPVKSFISKVVATSSLASAADSTSYLTSTKPNAGDYPWMKWYTVSVHSPVDVDIYDSHGGHMGTVPLSSIDPKFKDSDLMYLDDTIGGQYEAIGDEKYFTIPADETYTVQLKGTGTGNFTYQVQKFVGGNMTEVSNTVYTDLPVTPLLVASTTISSATTTPLLNLDVDGNGTVDIKTLPSPAMDPLLHLTAMKTIILSLHLKQNLEKNLLQKIDRVAKLIARDKQGKAIKKIKTLVERVENKHWDIKKLTEADKQTIVNMFSDLLANLESL